MKTKCEWCFYRHQVVCAGNLVCKTRFLDDGMDIWKRKNWKSKGQLNNFQAGEKWKRSANDVFITTRLFVQEIWSAQPGFWIMAWTFENGKTEKVKDSWIVFKQAKNENEVWMMFLSPPGCLKGNLVCKTRFLDDGIDIWKRKNWKSKGQLNSFQQAKNEN